MSLPRSGRGGASRSAATRAPRGARGGVFVQTPRSDIFVVLLAVSLGAIVLGCLLLLLVLNRYGFSSKATAFADPTPTATRLALVENPRDSSTVHL